METSSSEHLPITLLNKHAPYTTSNVKFRHECCDFAARNHKLFLCAIQPHGSLMRAKGWLSYNTVSSWERMNGSQISIGTVCSSGQIADSTTADYSMWQTEGTRHSCLSDTCSTYSGFKLHILSEDHTYCHISIRVQTKEGGPVWQICPSTVCVLECLQHLLSDSCPSMTAGSPHSPKDKTFPGQLPTLGLIYQARYGWNYLSLACTSIKTRKFGIFMKFQLVWKNLFIR